MGRVQSYQAILSEHYEALRSYLRRDGAGVGGSLLIHLLVLLAVLWFTHRALTEAPTEPPFVPVSLVAESEGPNPEPMQQKAAGVKSKVPVILPRAAVVHHTPTGVAPAKTKAPEDELEMQLKALSKLKQPNTDTQVQGDEGTSDMPQTGNDAESGGQGAYTTRDIIRAQVLRRWSLDMTKLGKRDFVILIHVLLKHDGTVIEADIVDAQRYKTDSTFRWIALSAKNAVILSSPLTLPPGVDGRTLDLTLRLDPRDTMQ